MAQGPKKRKPAKRKDRNKPTAGAGRGKPKVSKRAKRVAHGFVAASGAPSSSVKDNEDQQYAIDRSATAGGVRLNRWLAEQGVDSRRKCDQKVLDGEVSVNGAIIMEPGYRVQEDDDIMVNGARIHRARRLYYLFYKPRGVLCTNDPRETRTRLCDLVDPMVPSRVYPIGRLDEDSEGLILLTNDGDFSQLIAHPSHGVKKTYVCMISSSMSGDDLDRLRAGAWIEGSKVIPDNARIIRRTPSSTMLEITISEGRNREVRRLLARFGLGVKRLKRVRIGSLGITGVKRGMLRPLSRAERDALVKMALTSGDEGATTPPRTFRPQQRQFGSRSDRKARSKVSREEAASTRRGSRRGRPSKPSKSPNSPKPSRPNKSVKRGQ
ncbi:MAG: rRNA pseudouridine synthase [Planctomycetes bacterium]|nr:rRNA pseudouridine synthase [Planctomycetota bacterium]MCP4769858.1 rRNA pseudouridine synthase [Planctomycetota bacterium]MCP4859698.1 rRNA pseudouridine synthase [Planctomycetota bacterium]